ncbi:MAG: AfsR/SARP family transcriptional regulator [Dermatophilaceae bacterium]
MAATRRIRLLGRPTGVVPVRGHKPWAITAYLALAEGDSSRERLTDLLFAEADDPGAALRWNLAQVRRALGRPDALRGRVLSLPRDQQTCFDVDVLTGGRWQDAVRLPDLGAGLLEGMQFPECAAYETWLLGQRRRLSALTETLLHEAALTSMSVNAMPEAVRYAGSLVSLAPCVDSHQELLVRAYAVSGDVAAARRQLQSAVRLFRRELGCDPEPSVFLAAETAPLTRTRPATPARVQALIEAGQAQAAAGLPDTGTQVLRAACDEANRTGNLALEATAQLALGSTLIGAGTHHQDGELALHRAIACAMDSGEPAVASSAYRHLAASDVLRGNYPRADRRLASAKAAAGRDPGAELELASISGVSLLDQGDIDEATRVFRGGLDADPQRTHPFLPLMLAHTGRACLLGNDPQAARGYLLDSLDLARSRAWVGLTAAPLALLGHLAVTERDLASAQELLEHAYAHACQVADPCWETWSAHGLGLHAEASGDNASAMQHLTDAVTRSRPQRGGHLWSHVWALTDAVRLARTTDEPRAENWYDEALATAQRCGMHTLANQLLRLA